MGIRLNPDGTIDAEGVSGGGPVNFDPYTAEALGFGPTTLGPSDEGDFASGFDAPSDDDLMGLLGQSPAPDVGDDAEAIRGILGVDAPEVPQPATRPQAPQQPAPAPSPAQPQQSPALSIGLGRDLDAQNAAGGRMQDEAAQQATDSLRRYQEEANAIALREEQLALEEAAEQEQAAQEQAQIVERTRDEFASVQDEMEKLVAQEPDPGRFWANSKGFNQVAALIGGAISGYLRPGEPNAFVAAIQEQIDRDVALQQQQIERQLEIMAEKKALIGQMMDLDLEKSRALFAARTAKTQGVLKALQIAKARGADELQVARIEADIRAQYGKRLQDEVGKVAGVRMQQAQMAQQADEARKNRAHARAQQRREHDFRLKQLQAQQEAALAKAMFDAQNKKGEEQKKGPYGEGSVFIRKPGGKPNEGVWLNAGARADATGLRELMQTANASHTLNQALNKLDAFSRDPNWKGIDKEAAEQIKMLIQAANRQTIVGPGTLTKQDLGRLDRAITNPTEFWRVVSDDAIRAKLQLLVDSQVNGVKSIIETLPYDPAEGSVEWKPIDTGAFDSTINFIKTSGEPEDDGFEIVGNVELDRESLEQSISDRVAKEMGITHSAKIEQLERGNKPGPFDPSYEEWDQLKAQYDKIADEERRKFLDTALEVASAKTVEKDPALKEDKAILEKNEKRIRQLEAEFIQNGSLDKDDLRELQKLKARQRAGTLGTLDPDERKERKAKRKKSGPYSIGGGGAL